MSTIYTYGDTEYELPDGLSNEEALQRIKTYLESQAQEPRSSVIEPETEYEGAPQEFLEGVASGLIAIPQGILELGAIGVDLVADTDYATAVSDTAGQLRTNLGIDPEGFIGKGTEALVQFGIPGLGAAGAVSKVSKLGRLDRALRTGAAKRIQKGADAKLTLGEKTALGGMQVAAAGAADFVVATDGVTSIADFFEGGPTQTDKEIGLSGAEEAQRRLYNKLVLGAEAAAVSVAAPAALGFAGRVSDETGLTKAVTTGLQKGIAQPVKKVAESLDDKMRAIEARSLLGQDQSPVFNTLAEISSVFRYRGFLPDEVAETRLLVTGKTDAIIKRAKTILTGVEKNVEAALKEADKVSSGASPLTKQSIYNNIEAFLTGADDAARARALSELPKNVANEALKMRGLVRSLNESVLKSDYMDMLSKQVTKRGVNKGDKVKQEIQKNINTYLRRRYKAFEVKNYTPSKEAMETATKGFSENPKEILFELSEAVKREKDLVKRQELEKRYGIEKDDLGVYQFIDRIAGPSEEQARIAAQQFLGRYTKRKRGSGNTLARVAEYRTNPKIFLDKINFPKYKRELLGEITDPRESFLGTVADLAEFKAVDDYFGMIRGMATARNADGSFTNPGIARLFRDKAELTEDELKSYKDAGFKELDADEELADGQFGSLRGFLVPNQVFNDMTRVAYSDPSVLSRFALGAYSGFLKLKGGTQYAKTVLSPITQLRNVTTASAFALAQGNVGRGASLGESMRIVYEGLFKNLPEDMMVKQFNELQDLGIIGTQAQLREVQDLISKGLGFGVDEVNGIPVDRKFGSKLADSKLGGFLHNTGKGAESMYQAGDDLWKVYNYTFEVNKLRNAYRNMTDDEIIADLVARRNIDPKGKSAERLIKEEAARIVRNTVPNYNMVPEIIQFARRLPTGNFIAFPYEIIRTGVNTIARGVDEMASTNPEIRKIGLRRLTGALSTFTIAPMALEELAYTLTDITKDQMDAMKRSMVADYQKNNTLIPVQRDKETGIPIFIDYSFSNPYDFLTKGLVTALNEVETNRLKGKSSSAAVRDAMFTGLSEYFAPFTDESIIFGKLRDVLDPNAEAPVLKQLAQRIGGRAGQTVTGAQVYNKEDSDGDKLSKSFAHVLDAILPSVLPVDVRSGEFEASRFIRGFATSLGLNEELGISPVDRMNRERELSQELSRAMTGITEEKPTLLPLKYRGYEFSQRRIDAANIFTRVTNRANANTQDLTSAFTKSMDAQVRIQRDMYLVIQDMRTIGLKDNQIRKVFKEAGIGGYKKLMLKDRDGDPSPRFDIPKVSTTAIKNMRRNNLDIPMREFQNIRRQYRAIPVIVEEPQVQEQSSLSLPSLISSANAAAQPSSSVPAQAGAAVAPPAAPAPSTSVPDTSLLGSSPEDILKNLEIFQRTR